MQDHKQYFKQAYRTGTDIWTHAPLSSASSLLVEKLKPGAMILDVGAGRGLWAFYFAKEGFRVIALDYISEIIDKGNEEVKNRGLDKQLKFMEGDALDIPFTDGGFDAVLDAGLLQHLLQEDFETYAREVARVLKPDGYFLNVSLSKETVSLVKSFAHFFTPEKIAELFGKSFEIIKQTVERGQKKDNLSYIVTLMKKK